MAQSDSLNTIEFFGTTTYRLKINGLTLFLDSWLERLTVHKKYLSIDEVTVADYIFISHAHFDHLPGADRLAIRTGARIVGNPEVIRIMREAEVPEEQLFPVSGGERIPLFSRHVWEQTARGECALEPGLPGLPSRPHHSLASMVVDVWPSLHCLMPAEHPEILDTGTVFPSSDNPYRSTMDITFGMKYFLMRLDEILPPEALDDGMKSLMEFMRDPKNKFSHCDGGQLMYNFQFQNKAVLWSAHLGGYEGILRTLEPKPSLAILGAAGEANHNGRPFKGSAAQFLRQQCEWLGYPERIVWCLHDESPIKPYRVDTRSAEELIEKETPCRVWDLSPGKVYPLFD